MPVLVWEGKDETGEHHKNVPFRFLKKDNTRSRGNSENLLIEGDNLEALKSLMPYYRGKIKCVYIDPPYNTGEENWTYNDNVNSPQIKEWLGKVVGKEGEDLTRHDKWLCMLYPRLKLLKELLHKNGLIFISINDTGIEYMRMLMNEVFNKSNYRNSIIIKRGTSNIQSQFSTVQKIKGGYEFVLLYSKNPNYKIPKPIKDIEEKIGAWNNHWRSTDRPSLRYKLFGQTPKIGTWRWSEKRSLQAIQNYKNMAKELKTKKLEINQQNIDNWYLANIKKLHCEKIDLLRISRNNKPEHFVPPNRPELFTDVWLDVNSNGSRKLKTLLPNVHFDNPKSVDLLKRILSINLGKHDIVLDSFAGSGTTGHAVLELNKEDKGNRKFILIEIESTIAKNITSKRISKVVKSLGGGGDKKIGFTYYALGRELFDKNGTINTDCTYEQLASHIFLTETGNTISELNKRTKFLGKFNDIRIYLFYNKKRNCVLDFKTLKNLKKNIKKTIYADKCTVSKNKLKRYNCTFKHIPYEIDAS